ncbi:MAG: methionyl-tRNA formyltransferase [Bacilli bacterium]|nr:methionyl-tRNA formyltransferase [Bacilli bacterium]
MNIEDIETKRPLRIVFMGTPNFSVPILDVLIKNYKVKAVVTQPDKQVGRSGKVAKPPIKILAEKNNIVVIQLNKIKEEYQEIIDLDPDLIVTCAYGQILPKELLDYPRLGCINVHASLLPKLRGGAPIHRAVIEGHSKSGVTIMYMAPGMDDGDIISQKEVEITDTDTASTLHDKLSKLGSELLIETLPSIIEGTNKRIKQDERQVTFAPIIKPIDEKVDFSKTSKEVYNQIRGLNSFPGAYFMLEGKRFKVWESIIIDEYFPNKLDGEIVKIYKEGIGVKTHNGVIVLTVIQPEGKSRMNAKDYLNGLKESLIGKIIG